MTRLSKEGLYRVSGRVTVSFKDRDRVLSGESCPEGWSVRKFNGYIREDKKAAAPFLPKETTPVSDTLGTAAAVVSVAAQADVPPPQLA